MANTRTQEAIAKLEANVAAMAQRLNTLIEQQNTTNHALTRIQSQ